MLRITTRRLLASQRRLVGTVLAVFLGVSFVTGTLTLSDTLRANFADLFTAANSRIDVVVRSATQLSADGGQGPDVRQRGPLDASVVDRIRAVDGVGAALPSVEGYGQLLGADGRPVGGNGPPRLAGTWITDPELNPYRLVEGRAPRSEDEVVVNRGAAEAGRLAVGDTTTVQTPQPVRVTVVGIATFGEADGAGRSTFVGFSAAGATRHITKDPARISRVLVKASPGVSQAELVVRVRATVPAGVEAVTGAQLTRETIDDISGTFLTMLRTFLLIFAGVALLVGTFSIYNSFSILVAQRTREAALLRTLGATRGQIAASVLLETVAIGVLASLAGLAGGLGLAGLLKGLFDSFGFALPASGLVVSGWSMVVALVAGMVTTVGTGLVPAVRASAVAPLAALREIAVDRSATSRLRAAAGVLLTAAGAGLVGAGVAGGGGLGPAGLGSVLAVVGVVVLEPVAARPVVAVIGWPLVRFRGITGALARQNALRNPRRTAGSATALLVASGWWSSSPCSPPPCGRRRRAASPGRSAVTWPSPPPPSAAVA